jgi:serine/threonine-protein kinase
MRDAQDQPEMQVVEDCHMIGWRNPDSVLQCNTYLRTFRGGGAPALHWCVDPGSRLDYSVVRDNLLRHVGEFAALGFVSLNHQDPDITGNLIPFMQENPNLAGLVTEDTWRLVRHLNAAPKQLWFANKLKDNLLALPGGHRLQMVPTPFCHFRGAMAFYDPETQVLFSGDLFAGLNVPGRVQLFAEVDDWPGIAQFHQIYMPSREIVAYALRQVRGLDPPVKVIAPQHGFVLAGDFLGEVMARLENLPMGIDLLPGELDERYLPAYAEVFQEVVDLAAQRLGKSEVLSLLGRLPPGEELAGCMRVTADEAQLLRDGIRALPLLVDVLTRQHLPSLRETLKERVLRGCMERKAPLPQMGVGVEEWGAEMPGYWLG